MEEEGFKACEMDPCVFIRHTGTSWVLAWVYVDDMGVISNDEEEKERFIEQMGERFEIENKGVLQYYLGINVQHPSEGVVQLDQVKYITELVAEFDLAGSYPAASPISGKPSTDTTELREVMATRYGRMVACLVYVSTNIPLQSLHRLSSTLTENSHTPHQNIIPLTTQSMHNKLALNQGRGGWVSEETILSTTQIVQPNFETKISNL